MSDAKQFIENLDDEVGPYPPKYNRGDRVRLIELEDGCDGDSESEAVPPEDGIVISASWQNWGDYMYVVEVDEKFREDGDDGLREVMDDQIQYKLLN